MHRGGEALVSDSIKERILSELRQAPRGQVYLWRLSGLTAFDLTALLEEWLQAGVIKLDPATGMVRKAGWKEESA